MKRANKNKYKYCGSEKLKFYTSNGDYPQCIVLSSRVNYLRIKIGNTAEKISRIVSKPHNFFAGVTGSNTDSIVSDSTFSIDDPI